SGARGRRGPARPGKPRGRPDGVRPAPPHRGRPAPPACQGLRTRSPAPRRRVAHCRRRSARCSYPCWATSGASWSSWSTAWSPAWRTGGGRPRSRCPCQRAEPAATMIAGVLLAAGAGRRYGMPKALAEGGAWLRRSVAVLIDGGCAPVLVVLGASAQQAAPLVPDIARTVVAADWAEGMGASLRTGLAAVAADTGPEVQAALVHLVDLPDVDA